ncbi:MAG: hypothetical protein J7J14_01780, partial [Thermotogaceae bacterium]|nr:hypothetical protein [Thermotogaceae bacterium]
IISFAFEFTSIVLEGGTTVIFLEIIHIPSRIVRMKAIRFSSEKSIRNDYITVIEMKTFH